MSRRASLFNRENPARKTKVRFPDDLVFLDDVKDNDIEAMSCMLRRASLEMDINAIMPSGMAPLHQAVLNGNILAVSLLISHGADVNKPDEDTWTPLHAACSEGHLEIVRFLLDHDAKRTVLTDEGERPIDLVDPNDFRLIALLLGNQFFKNKKTRKRTNPDDSDSENENGDSTSDGDFDDCNDVIDDDVTKDNDVTSGKNDNKYDGDETDQNDMSSQTIDETDLAEDIASSLNMNEFDVKDTGMSTENDEVSTENDAKLPDTNTEPVDGTIDTIPAKEETT